MDAITSLKTWVELEHKQAKVNVAQSRHEIEGFYHRYNTGREAALRGVLDKINVLLEVAAVPMSETSEVKND